MSVVAVRTELKVAFAKDGVLPDPEGSANPELQCTLPWALDTNKRTSLANQCKGKREENDNGCPQVE